MADSDRRETSGAGNSAKPAVVPPAAKAAAAKAAAEREARRRADVAKADNPTWWAPVFVTLLVVGLLWIVVYYVSEGLWPIYAFRYWNLGIGFTLLIGGFLMTMRWR